MDKVEGTEDDSISITLEKILAPGGELEATIPLTEEEAIEMQQDRRPIGVRSVSQDESQRSQLSPQQL